MGAFQKWTWAKAVNLQGLVGEPNAYARSLELAEEAIDRGGKSSWFNRLRASLNRARKEARKPASVEAVEYSLALIRAFDDVLERIGSIERFDKYMNRMRERLRNGTHNEFCEALEESGRLLGYNATRPKGQAASDTRWRGTFGNVREVFTFEAKVEHADGNAITPTQMGQAHNQLNRALAEFSSLGYAVRGTLVTHLASVEPAAKSAAGPLRIIQKAAVEALMERVLGILSLYRDKWSLDDVSARRLAAEKILPKCPPTGWLQRVLDRDSLFISPSDILKEWPK
jgi:hypothetical protein